VQHPIEARFRAVASGFSVGVVQPLISQCRHDLPWRQYGVLGLVAGQQDSLALLLTEPMGDMTITTFTAIVAVTITRKGLPPALERAQTDADLTAGANQASAGIIRLADQLDHLPPVRGAGQPSASSEQKASHFFRSTSNAAISATGLIQSVVTG
jgi:hypothetical protein